MRAPRQCSDLLERLQRIRPSDRRAGILSVWYDGGRQVLFTSDRTGYGNLYLADVPDFDTLPPVEDK